MFLVTLGKLEKNGSIKVERSPRQAIFYSVEITDDQAKIIKALRRDTPRKIIYSLMLKDGLEFSDIVKQVLKSPSTVVCCITHHSSDLIV